jgi:hypothetical protein
VNDHCGTDLVAIGKTSVDIALALKAEQDFGKQALTLIKIVDRAQVERAQHRQCSASDCGLA